MKKRLSLLLAGALLCSTVTPAQAFSATSAYFTGLGAFIGAAIGFLTYKNDTSKAQANNPSEAQNTSTYAHLGKLTSFGALSGGILGFLFSTLFEGIDWDKISKFDYKSLEMSISSPVGKKLGLDEFKQSISEDTTISKKIHAADVLFGSNKGISFTRESVNKAYLTQARIWHPQQQDSDLEVFNTILKARKKLLKWVYMTQENGASVDADLRMKGIKPSKDSKIVVPKHIVSQLNIKSIVDDTVLSNDGTINHAAQSVKVTDMLAIDATQQLSEDIIEKAYLKQAWTINENDDNNKQALKLLARARDLLLKYVEYQTFLTTGSINY